MMRKALILAGVIGSFLVISTLFGIMASKCAEPTPVDAICQKACYPNPVDRIYGRQCFCKADIVIREMTDEKVPGN